MAIFVYTILAYFRVSGIIVLFSVRGRYSKQNDDTIATGPTSLYELPPPHDATEDKTKGKRRLANKMN